MENSTEKLGGRIGELPSIHFCMPLGAKSRSKGLQNGVLKKCQKKLTNWKSQYLPQGGRLTLINGVRCSTFLYDIHISSSYKCDQEAYAVGRNFLWEGSEDTKKFHPVKWEELTVSEEAGRMGIRNLKKQNQML